MLSGFMFSTAGIEKRRLTGYLKIQSAECVNFFCGTEQHVVAALTAGLLNDSTGSNRGTILLLTEDDLSSLISKLQSLQMKISQRSE